MPFQVGHSPDHNGIVVIGLLTSAEEAAEFKSAFNVASGVVDCYYHDDGGTIYFNAVSERCKAFFYNTFSWTKDTHGHGSYPNTSGWGKQPPADFVFVELKPGMELPDHAWGKRPI